MLVSLGEARARVAASGKQDARKVDLLRLSVLIPTRDRLKDLAYLPRAC
jgi:hypothetical protein